MPEKKEFYELPLPDDFTDRERPVKTIGEFKGNLDMIIEGMCGASQNGDKELAKAKANEAIAFTGAYMWLAYNQEKHLLVGAALNYLCKWRGIIGDVFNQKYIKLFEFDEKGKKQMEESLPMVLSSKAEVYQEITHTTIYGDLSELVLRKEPGVGYKMDKFRLRWTG